MNDRSEMAARLRNLRKRWFALTNELCALKTGENGDRITKQIDSVEYEMRSAIVDAAALLDSAERQLAILPDLLKATNLFDDVMRCRRDGPWRDVPAFRLRWSIPEDETVEAFCQRTIADAIAKSQAVRP